MNYGMYLSATGALTSMHRQDVIANNLANVQTVGFKQHEVAFKARPVERLEDPSFSAAPSLTLEELTGGHFVAPTRVNLQEGPLQETGNPLDLAIRGDGFFVVRSGSGNEAHRLTRDGRLTLNADNEIVLAAGGAPVLDVNGSPVRVTPGASLRIDKEGAVFENDVQTTRLWVAAVKDPSLLEKTGETLFRYGGRMDDLVDAGAARIEPGYVEGSTVDPVLTLNAMITATKSVQANAKMIQFHDTLMDQAINRFGRVA